MTDEPQQAFTEQFRSRHRIVASAAFVLASTAPFVVGLTLITYLPGDPNGWVARIVTVGAFCFAVALTWLAQDRLALLGNDLLRERLGARLGELRDIAGCTHEGIFVGFSPGEDVRVWGGETDLDVGYLCVAEHGMVFVGDRFTWSLSKSRVDQIDLTPAPAGPRRILVRWHAPREPRRAFTIESRDAQSLSEAIEGTIELFRALRKWSVSEPIEPADGPTLGNPPVGDHGGKPVHELANGSCSVLLGMATIIILTTWYLVGQMLEDGFYCHAVLWAGFVFVGGAVFTRCLLNYLQSTEGPRSKGSTERPRRPEHPEF